MVLERNSAVLYEELSSVGYYGDTLLLQNFSELNCQRIEHFKYCLHFHLTHYQVSQISSFPFNFWNISRLLCQLWYDPQLSTQHDARLYVAAHPAPLHSNLDCAPGALGFYVAAHRRRYTLLRLRTRCPRILHCRAPGAVRLSLGCAPSAFRLYAACARLSPWKSCCRWAGCSRQTTWTATACVAARRSIPRTRSGPWRTTPSSTAAASDVWNAVPSSHSRQGERWPLCAVHKTHQGSSCDAALQKGRWIYTLY